MTQAVARKSNRTVISVLKDPATVTRVREMLPRDRDEQRFLRTVLLAVNKNPALLECDPISMIGAVVQAAWFGLEPNALGHGYLLPFKKWSGGQVVRVDCQFLPGYQGMLDLARRGGGLKKPHADVVYTGDDFSFAYGTNEHLHHVPSGNRNEDESRWAYCCVKADDEFVFEVMPWSDVLKIRGRAQAYQQALRSKAEAEDTNKRMTDKQRAFKLRSYEESPWVAWLHQMAKKTAIKQLCKVLPLSLEQLHTARAVDDLVEAGKMDTREIGLGAHPADMPEKDEGDVLDLMATAPTEKPHPDDYEDEADTSSASSSGSSTTATETPEGDKQGDAKTEDRGIGSGNVEREDLNVQPELPTGDDDKEDNPYSHLDFDPNDVETEVREWMDGFETVDQLKKVRANHAEHLKMMSEFPQFQGLEQELDAAIKKAEK